MRSSTIIVILTGLLLFACNQSPVAKPDNLLSEEVMIEILYDTALLQAANGYVPKKLSDNNINVKNFIYNKYNIDSATYYQNHKYYAADLENYKKMYKKIAARLEIANTKLDSLDGSKNISSKEDKEKRKKGKKPVPNWKD